jgi:rare lipoprotein A
MARRGAGLVTILRGLALSLLAVGGLSACASTQGPVGALGSAGGGERPRAYNRPYAVNGRWYRPASQPSYDVVGVASWYSYESHNRTTSDGEVFDARLPTAAHTTLPIPSYLEVTNLDNGRRLRVRLNDRGPFVAGRLIDLSRGAATQLGFVGKGTARVRVRYLGPAPLRPNEAMATAQFSAWTPEEAQAGADPGD